MGETMKVIHLATRTVRAAMAQSIIGPRWPHEYVMAVVRAPSYHYEEGCSISNTTKYVFDKLLICNYDVQLAARRTAQGPVRRCEAAAFIFIICFTPGAIS